MSALLADLAWNAFRLGFGLFSLASVWISTALSSGTLWARDSAEEKRELAAAQDKYWSLDKAPLKGFRHAFFETREHVKLHYVVNADEGEKTKKNLAIFIHGFPDSFLLWRYILQSPDLQDHVLVAVDMPGYGGSDSLPQYGPNEVLEAMGDFIVGARELFLQRGGKCVVVSHDWGALVGARLASEAAVLADHWIITSGILPHAAAYNAFSQWTLACQMLRTWTRQPLNTTLLRNAMRALKPIAGQFRRSFYIFCFLLPSPFSSFFASFGNYWFLRIMHSLSEGNGKKKEELLKRLSVPAAAEAMSVSTGPALEQLDSPPTANAKYGESVRRRVTDRGMSQKIRFYRESLFLGPWEKSLELTAALFELQPSGGSSSPTIPKGALKAPATLLLGEYDLAFDRKLALDNIRDYLVKGSRVLLMKGGGHWLPTEPKGRRVIEEIVSGAFDGMSDKAAYIERGDVKVVVEA